MEFNARHPETKVRYADLARRSGLVSEDCPDTDSVEALLVRVRHLLSLANFPSSLRELGFEEADLGGLAQRASEQWTAGFNPRPIEASDFFRLYSSIFKYAPCFEETQGLS